jgi:hypothetical protein
MRLIILVPTLTPLATAQEHGLTEEEVPQHIDAMETNIMSTQELNITILFGWLAASHLAAQKLTRNQFLLASLSYSIVTFTLILQIIVGGINSLELTGEIGFIILRSLVIIG